MGRKQEVELTEYEQALASDFRNFLFAVWQYLGLPEPTPIQYEIANILQSGESRRMIQAFRGIGKSWICSAYVLWYLRFIDRNYKFLIVSASKSRSDDFSSFTKKLINEMPILACLQATEGQRDSSIAYDVGGCTPAHAASVKSVGIFGQLTGSRANEIIADDIEVPNNSATQDMREKLEKASKEFEAILSPGGKITYLGTPQTEESVYRNLPERGYKVSIFPVRVPAPDQISKFNGNLHQYILDLIEQGESGNSTEPLRFSDFDLMEREASYGKSGFQLQFMLDCSLSDALKYPLKTSDLIVTDLDKDKGPISISYCSSPDKQIKDIQNFGFSGDRYYHPLFISSEFAPYESKIMAIDPAGSGADEMAYCVLAQLHGKLFLLELSGLQGGYSEANILKIANIAKEFGVNEILVESNFGQGMFSQLLKPILQSINYVCSIEDVRASTQKELRIITTLEPVLNSHKLVIDKGTLRRDIESNLESSDYSLIRQLTHISKQRGCLPKDDRVDVLAAAANYYLESMARNESNAIDDYKASLLMTELDKFMDGVFLFGGNSNSPNWMN